MRALVLNGSLFCFLLIFHSILAFSQSAKSSLTHTAYYSGSIKPDCVSQSQMDLQLFDFYKQWKGRYVKNVPGKDQSFIWFENKGGKQCVSEGQGYGMMITALMRKKDPSAQQLFNKLFYYYRAHPSGKGKHLMAWAQNMKGKDLDNTSASDGDMDIAFSLLLADKNWGSTGAINYLQSAKLIINDIMRFEINQLSWSVLLSDGVEAESPDYFDTRSSDFMPSHFKAFEIATGDVRWLKVTDAGYKLFNYVQRKYSPDAGLVPDFIVNINKAAKPAPPHFLESVYDGCYNYNACRVPWRIGIDYLLTGDARAKAFTAKINSWVRSTTNNNPYNLSAGYTLAGNDLKNRYFEALSFIGPFCVSAMTDKQNQAWLNNVYKYLTDFKLKDYDYYDNSIKLINLIIISGNYRQ